MENKEEPTNIKEAAEEFSECHKSCIPKKCGKKVKLVDCKFPVSEYEKCIAENKDCKALAKWVKSGHENEKEFNMMDAEKCVKACGFDSENKYVKGAARCVNNCSVQLKKTTDALNRGTVLALGWVLALVTAFVI